MFYVHILLKKSTQRLEEEHLKKKIININLLVLFLISVDQSMFNKLSTQFIYSSKYSF